jgi:hypothetical protein
MKTRILIALAVCAAVVATVVVVHKNNKRPDPRILHVTSADTCDLRVEGTIGNMTYSLKTMHQPSGAACWGPIGLKEIGKDFPATVNLDRGIVTVKVQSVIEDKSVPADTYGFHMRQIDQHEYEIEHMEESRQK